MGTGQVIQRLLQRNKSLSNTKLPNLPMSKGARRVEQVKNEMRWPIFACIAHANVRMKALQSKRAFGSKVFHAPSFYGNLHVVHRFGCESFPRSGDADLARPLGQHPKPTKLCFSATSTVACTARSKFQRCHCGPESETSVLFHRGLQAGCSRIRTQQFDNVPRSSEIVDRLSNKTHGGSWPAPSTSHV